MASLTVEGLTDDEELELLDLDDQDLKDEEEVLMIQAQALQAPPEAPQAAPQEERDISGLDIAGQLAGGVNKGILDLANLPFQAAGYGYNAINEGTFFPEAENKGIYNIPAIKAATERTIPKGENALMDAGFTAGEWGTGLAKTGVTKGFDALSKLNKFRQAPVMPKMPNMAPIKEGLMGGGSKLISEAKKLGPVGLTKEVAKLPYTAPKAALKTLLKSPEVAMVTGAVGGEAVGGPTGEVIGGFTALAAAIRAGKTPSNFTKAEKKAVKFIKDNAENSDLALANYRAAALRGEKGTLADLTKDAGLYNLEAAAPKGTKTSRAIDAQMVEREQQIAGDVRSQFGTGDARLAPEAARGELLKTQRAMQEGADKVTQGLDQTANVGLTKAKAAQELAEREAQQLAQSADDLLPTVATDLKTAQTSGNLVTGLDDLTVKLKKELTTPAWEKFENGSPIEVTELKAVVTEALNKMPPEAGKDLVAKYKKILTHMGKWGKEADPKSIQYVKSRIGNLTNEAKSSGSYGYLEKELDGISELVQQSLKNPLNRTDYEKAIKASTELYERTGKNTKIGKAMNNDEWETFTDRIGFDGRAGAGTGRYLKRSDHPKTVENVEEHMKALAKEEGLDAKFMAKYDQFLDHFPDIKSKLEKVSKSKLKATMAKEQAEKVTKETTKTTSALKDTLAKETKQVGKEQKGLTKAISGEILAKYDAKPIETIQELLKSKDGAKELEKLNRGMKMSGGGDAFKAHLGDELEKILSAAPEGVQRVSASSIGKFKNMRKTLVDSKVITQKEADSIAEALQRSDTVFLRRSAGKQAVEAKLSEVDKAMASGGSAVLMSGTGGGNQLMMQAAVRRQLVSYIQRQKYSKKVLDQIDGFLANPDKFYDAATKLEKGATPEKIAKSLLAAIQAQGQVTSELSGSE